MSAMEPHTFSIRANRRTWLWRENGQLAWELKDLGPPHCCQAQELVSQPQQKPSEKVEGCSAQTHQDPHGRNHCEEGDGHQAWKLRGTHQPLQKTHDSGCPPWEPCG
ncbi:hypothetical protein E2C01_053995 [Portunus trituberculatus]|uniref:Uncharacterized protein n=1 Tax=Portunus trituberculatus TaxID=210409 RepID=A0A5B7GQS4_PORTR|nr:hypothetical protein [Portunus trituberculatus]